jgi:transcriptional regulator with XRE-family HTH domain
MKEIYNNIKTLRKEKKISQEEMAIRLDMFQANYGKLERGMTELTLSRLYKIGEILGVEIEVILGISKPVQTSLPEVDIEKLKKENKEQSEKIEALEDYSKRLKKDLDFFKILFTESGFAVIIILQAIFNISKHLKEKVEAIKNYDAVTDLNLSNEIYREFESVLEFGQFNEFEFGLKDELNNSVIATPISVLDTLVNSDNILKMTLKDDNISLFRKEYFRFLDRYEKEKKENKK